MKQVVSSDFKLGIMAGGQLGKMLILAANNWDIQTYVLDPSNDCPSANCCTKLINGSIVNYDDVYAFGQLVDAITVEIENVNVEALRKLKQEGKIVHPDPDALALIKDKGLQKQFYAEHNLPTSPFELYDGEQAIREAIDNGQLKFPFVQKARTAGYDGKGVAVIKDESSLKNLLAAPSVVEDAVIIKKELAVTVARNPSGETKCFPIVEMEFSETANLVEQLICPANVDAKITQQANELATSIITELNMCGLLAVEFFLDTDDRLWINEVAPRPHNSGHHTIEACVTSQYEQHLRAILDFPLGNTDIISPSVMINLLGEEGYTGSVNYDGLAECMKVAGAKFHIYGKKETRPFRKMGHATILASTLNEAKERANEVKNTLKVKATS